MFQKILINLKILIFELINEMSFVKLNFQYNIYLMFHLLQNVFLNKLEEYDSNNLLNRKTLMIYNMNLNLNILYLLDYLV